MFGRIICPDPAYEQLKKSGVMDIILSEVTKESIQDILLYRCLKEEVISDALNVLELNRFNSRNEKIIMYEDLISCNADYNTDEFTGFGDFDSLLIKHPIYLGHLVLGEELLKYNEFGFNNRVSLEKAVTAFYIGERHEFSSCADEWVWRNSGFKNEIHRNIHGDLSVSQMDSSGRDYEKKTLFGDVRIFDCMKRVDSFGFGEHQDWSKFLGSLLKYSERVGMEDIPEISDWGGTLEGIGARGGNWAEAFGECYNAEFNAHMLMDNQLMCDGEKLKRFPFVIWNGNASTVPFFKDGKLMYMKEDKEGDIEFDEECFKGERFSKVVEYSPDDLSHAMRGVLKYFARSREMIPAIMNEFKRK